MLDYQIVSPDRTESLVLGKLFVMLFMGEVGEGIPYTGIYYSDDRYIDYYVLKYKSSIISPQILEKNNRQINYEYATIDGKITRTTSLFYEGIEEKIQGPLTENVQFELRPNSRDIFYVRRFLTGSSDADRWLKRSSPSFDLKRQSVEIKFDGSRRMLVEAKEIQRKNNKIVLKAGKDSSTIRISFQKVEPKKSIPNFVYKAFPKIKTDDKRFESLYDHSIINLSNTLESPFDGCFFPLSAVPWFHTIFGRDSTITSIHGMLFNPLIAKSTIEKLGELIGKKYDRIKEEEPGKIIHEKRFGEVSGKDRVLSGYYGSVDATPLYVLTYLSYLKHHPQDDSLKKYEGEVLSALRWIKKAVKTDGLLGYKGESMLSNQAWKDSWDSVSHRDGSIPPHPLYLIEVQGYAVKALEGGAELLDDRHERRELTHLSEQLHDSIKEKYWSQKMSYFGEAIDGKGRLTEILTSNPGHLLWMNAITKGFAEKVAQLLVDRNKLNSGYGVKTLAYGEVRHNPLSYHNGSVWPHDSMIILSGLARYNLREEFSELLLELLDAYSELGLTGLPELFSGERREKVRKLAPMGGFPIAWCDAGILGILHSMLGLDVQHDDPYKVTVSPILPKWMNELAIKGLHILGGRLDVRIKRVGGKIKTDCNFAVEPHSPFRLETQERL